MKTKLKNTKREFSYSNNVTKCQLIHELSINRLLDCYDNVNLIRILNQDERWIKFVNEEIVKSGSVQVKTSYPSNIITIITTGKSICHDGDAFSAKRGEHIAEDRALLKALKIENRIINKITSIFNMYVKALQTVKTYNNSIMQKSKVRVMMRTGEYVTLAKIED